MPPLPGTQTASGGEVEPRYCRVWKVSEMTHHTTAKRSGFRLFSYIGEIINELKKVVWLTRREVAYLTALVLIVSIIAGIVLGALDYGFSVLVDRVFLGK